MAGLTLERLEKELAQADTKDSEGELPPIEDAAILISKPIVLPDDVIEGALHIAAAKSLAAAHRSLTRRGC